MRNGILIAATLAGGFTVASAEILSLFRAVNREVVACVWIVAAVVAVIACSIRRPECPSLQRPALLELVPMLAVVLVLGVTLTTVCLCPPNNWDVVLYHLPRQVQWLQQGGVGHFPTQDYRLTVNPPFAEFVGLHLMAIFQTDRLNALVSWGALVLTLVAVSLLAKELGVHRLGQWLAAAFAATIPMGIHEAVSGKNDGMVALWFVLSTLWFVRLWFAGRASDGNSDPSLARPANGSLGLLFGLSIGLLLLTKGTGAVFAAPIVLLALVRLVWKRPPGAFRAAAIAATIIVALNIGHWSRNVHAYGSLAGQTFGLGNARHDPVALASNITRNLAMNLATGSAKANRSIEKRVAEFHAWLGIDANEPAITWGGNAFHVLHAPHQEAAAAPLHALTMLCCGLVGLFHFRRATSSWWLVIAIFVGASLAFCVAFKWQPWHPRLHLPLVTLTGVVFGAVFSRPRLVWSSPILVAILFAGSLPALFLSEYRPWFAEGGLTIFEKNKTRLRMHEPSLIANHVVIVQMLDGGVQHVALINHGARPAEYPLTHWLRWGHNPRQVGYFYPVSGSPPSPPPDAVIDVVGVPGPEYIRHASGRVYRAERVFLPYVLYRPLRPDETPPPGATLDHPIGRFGVGVEEARKE